MAAEIVLRLLLLAASFVHRLTAESVSLLSQSAGPIVWVTSGLTRVAGDALPGETQEVRLWAAMRECRDFQIVVRAPAGGLTNANVSVSDLAGPHGHIVPQSSFSLYREHYVTVTQASRDQGGSNRSLGPGLYPDGLIPFVDPETGQAPANAPLRAVPFNVAGNQNQPIWVDLYTPPGTPAGLYSGAITITTDQGIATVPIALEVWPFELPLRPSLHSSFAIYNPGAEVPANQKVLLRHRLMPRIVNPQDAPALAKEFGLNITALWIWTHAKYGNCVLPPAPAVSVLTQEASRNPSGIPLYVYSADEIGECPELFPALKTWASVIHQAGVMNLVAVPPLPALRDDGSGRSVVDYWAMLPGDLTEHAADVAAVQKKGDEVWSYNALVQDSYSPKWLMDYDPVNYRMQAGFLSQQQGLKGLLYWRVNNWGADPWSNADYSENGKPYPGEGMLVYPGAQVGTAGFAPSLRLKALRDGVEDFEYVEILKRAGRGAWALQQVRAVAPDWIRWNHDPQALENLRLRLGQEIGRLAAEHSLDGGGLIRTVPPGATPVSREY